MGGGGRGETGRGCREPRTSKMVQDWQSVKFTLCQHVHDLHVNINIYHVCCMLCLVGP